MLTYLIRLFEILGIYYHPHRTIEYHWQYVFMLAWMAQLWTLQQ